MRSFLSDSGGFFRIGLVDDATVERPEHIVTGLQDYVWSREWADCGADDCLFQLKERGGRLPGKEISIQCKVSCLYWVFGRAKWLICMWLQSCLGLAHLSQRMGTPNIWRLK